MEKDGSIAISTSLYPDMPDIQVTTPGVLKLLSQVDVRKSMGPDGISQWILKGTSHEVAPILTFIFNQSLSSGVVPQDWRLANIFALHKKGPKDLAENYRPVSLTSICSILLEHVVYSSVSNFLDDNQILTPHQHGFRSGYLFETQLVLAVNDWAKSLDMVSAQTLLFLISRKPSIRPTPSVTVKARPSRYLSKNQSMDFIISLRPKSTCCTEQCPIIMDSSTVWRTSGHSTWSSAISPIC